MAYENRLIREIADFTLTNLQTNLKAGQIAVTSDTSQVCFKDASGSFDKCATIDDAVSFLDVSVNKKVKNVSYTNTYVSLDQYAASFVADSKNIIATDGTTIAIGGATFDQDIILRAYLNANALRVDGASGYVGINCDPASKTRFCIIEGTTDAEHIALRLGTNNNGSSTKVAIQFVEDEDGTPAELGRIRGIHGGGIECSHNFKMTGTYKVYTNYVYSITADDNITFRGTSFLFGTNGETYISSNTIGFDYATDGVSTGKINYYGYNGGTTQFRNLAVCDGKQNLVSQFTGSTKELELFGQLRQQTYHRQAIISKASIADNSATAFATITTTDESGDNDGGGYLCKVTGMVAHAALSNSGNCATTVFDGTFNRAQTGDGTGVNSAVTDWTHELSGLAATDAGSRTITSTAMTVTETTEYVQTLNITIDLAGTAVTTAEIVFLVEVFYYGFTTAPVIAAA